MPSARPCRLWQFRIDASIPRRIPRQSEAAGVADMFGLRGPRTEVLYEGLELTVAPGQIVAVVGPSGSGKSVLLREVLRQAHRRRDVVGLDCDALAVSPLPAVTAVGDGPLCRRLELLARCGLAEAGVLIAPARRLSGGELYRLALAGAMLQARRVGGALIVADEFAANLDPTTAWVVCRQLRRCISASVGGGAPMAALLAGPRPELLEALEPDRVILKPLGGPPRLVSAAEANRTATTGPLEIERGTIADYRALERFHYVAGPPAAHKRVWVIRPEPGAWGCGPAAVLVVSPPVLRCRGRNAAFPGRYTRNRKTGLARLNQEIECVSRVVVHPTFRGLGLGVALVRHSLATAETPVVEALAAMGRVHPLFEKAGMYSFGAFEGNLRYVYYLGRHMPYVVRKPRRRRRA